jgi:MOSC domain-containing protein YiiM
MVGIVTAVSRSSGHDFSKSRRQSITLIAGLGVEGDVHLGATVRHRSRVARDPSQPNLRQVHLIHRELFDELANAGYTVNSGELGENITTSDIDLLRLPTGALLHIGVDAVVEVTGLRNPCVQIDGYQQGLLKHVVHRDTHGNLVRKAGVMGIVRTGGTVRPGDHVSAVLPEGPHRPLERV